MRLYKQIFHLFFFLIGVTAVACTSPPNPAPTPTQALLAATEIPLIATEAVPTATMPPLPSPTTAVITNNDTPMQDEAAVTAWREDLAFLARRMADIHPNLYWRHSEAEFQTAVQNLDAQIPELTDQQIIVEMARIVAFIDGHSAISTFAEPANFHLYPLRLFQFSDGLFVIDAQAPFTELIGGKVVQIGQLPIVDALAAITPLVPHDNAMTIQLLAPNWLMRPEVLFALGIIESIENPQIVVETAVGTQQTINPTLITSEEYRAWSGGPMVGLPQRPAPLYLSRAFSDNYWFTYLEDSGTLYIQYNRVQGGINTLTSELTDFLEEQEVERVVLDLRHNPGGDNTTYGTFLNFLTAHPQVNRHGRFFTILGRQTFSAAANFATELENQTHTIFVGEPMGGSPNLFGDVVPSSLPNSRLQVNISARYWEKSTPEDTRESIEPDLPAPLSSQDFFDARDPALEAILAFDFADGYRPANNPLLAPNPNADWESADVRDPYVIKVDDTYYLFYAGQDATGVTAIGYATSQNGKKWFRAAANPILTGSGEGFDAHSVAAPVVRLEEGVWMLYYAASATAGQTTAVGQATAATPNGPWQREETSLLLVGEVSAWDSFSITPGAVVDVEGGQRLYYSGFSRSQEIGIGFAESSDAVTWTKYDNADTSTASLMSSDPVLAGAERGAWDEIVWAPYVQQRDGQWQMFYHGDPFSTRGSNEIGIGVATSVDGITWLRPDEPILTLTEDGRFPHTPAVWTEGDILYLYYASVKDGGTASQIELAILPQ